MKKILPVIILLSVTYCLSAQLIEPRQQKGLYGFKIGPKLVVDFQYDTIQDLYQHYFYVRKEGNWGMINPQGREVIPCKYDKLETLWRNKISAATDNGFQGILDSNGIVILDFLYDDIDHMEEKKALVKYHGQWCWVENGIYNYNEDDLVFFRPDTLPIFSGCVNNFNTFKEFQECSSGLMYDFIYKNIAYPRRAQEESIEGKVLLRFIVSRKGNVQNIEVVRSLGYGCDEECVAVLNKMPPWIPARHEGKNVASTYLLPVTFVLD